MPDIAAAIDALIQLLRFTIKKAGGMVSISEEVDYIKNYIAVQRNRYGNQFCVKYDISPDVLDIQIPGFVLQPIVENCFVHGLDMSRDDGEINISARQEGDLLYVSVQDNGVGMTDEQIHQLLLPASEKKQHGLNSIGMNRGVQNTAYGYKWQYASL